MSSYDFLGGGSSLEDMIECDINSEFNDGGSFTPLASPTFGDTNTTDTGIQHNSIDLGLGLDDSKGLGDLSWMQQTVNVNEIQGIVAVPVPAENNDPNLPVNPQTGLPTSPSEVQITMEPLSQESNGVGDGVGDDAIMDTEVAMAASPNIQFITSPLPSTPSIASPLGSPAPATPQPAIAYMTANGSSAAAAVVSASAIPSTLKNIQNNAHSTVSSVTTYHQTLTQHLLTSNNNHKVTKRIVEEKQYPKPVYSYSCLIAMALKNSETGALPVSEIYSFMT